MAKTPASAILASILTICENKDQKADESRQDFLMRCIKSMNGLSDKDWEELSKGAQDWFNAAADIAEDNKKSGKNEPLPDFPDLPKAADEEKPSSRRRASSSDAEDAGVVKVGRHVTVVTRRGKEVSGEVVEYDKETIVVKDKDGEKHEFDVEPLKEVRVHNDGAKPEPEAEPARGPRAGDEVSFTTKRGRAVSGTLVELTDEDVLVKTSEGQEEFMLSRIEGEISFGAGKGPAKAKDDEAAASRRGSAGAKDEPAKSPRVVNKGVSVGQRCKELMALDPDLALEDLKKRLKADGIDFKDVTVEMNYTELSKFVAELKKNKRLK